MSSLTWSVVILAAGQGSRLRSATPKVLHRVAGRCLVDHVLDQAATVTARPQDVTVVVGHGAAAVRTHLAARRVATVLQEPQLGTGHALQVAVTAIADLPEALLVLSGDVPLLRPATLATLAARLDGATAAVLLTAELAAPGSYGRVVRDEVGSVVAIVEARDADSATLALREVNAGVYAFRRDPLVAALANLDTANAQREYYLTDVVAALRRAGRTVEAVVLADPDEMLGVNTRADLARVGRVLNDRILAALMTSGVTVVDPATTWVEADCRVEPDVVLEPGVVLRGCTSVGRGAVIGAHAVCEAAVVAADEVVPPLSYRRS